MKKLNFFGIGPKIGMVAIPYFIVTLLLSTYFHSHFKFCNNCVETLWFLGVIFTSIGIIFYITTVVMLLKAVKNTRLLTGGTYYFCQNPLYASIMLMILPGIAFLMNSWLILTTCIIAYFRFKTLIHNEYTEMEEFFGETYREYKKNTPELFPFPFKKIFKK